MKLNSTLNGHRIFAQWPRPVVLVALTCLMISGCEKHVKWSEEVKLSTGETITIDRDVRHKGGGAAWPQGQGSIPMEHLIRFQYPPKTGPLIEWRSTKVGYVGTYAELPLVMDISPDKTWFIFTENASVPACDRYIRYQFRNGSWVETPLPEKISPLIPNLYLAAGGNDIEDHVTLAEKAKESSARGYPHYIRQVGPDTYWCSADYKGPYPPVEAPDCRRFPMHPACGR